MASRTCYTKNNGTIYISSGQVPCITTTGQTQCCASGDQCGPDGFCHFTHAQADTVTGYYLGGCTDQTFSNAVCPQHCSGRETQDSVYNATSGLWKCCFTDAGLNCDNPSSESWSADSPAQILAAISTGTYPFTSATSSSSSSRSSSTLSSSTSSTSGSAASTSTSSATSGATIAASSGSTSTPLGSIIAPAVIVPLVAIIIGVGFYLWFMKRRRQRAAGIVGDSAPMEQNRYNEMSAEPSHAVSELPAKTQPRVSEMYAPVEKPRNFHELAG